MHITKMEARRFLLVKHGLYGERVFKGEEGILDFIRQAGCIQFDPIDICGKNPELVLQSRIAGFRPEHLYKLLYTDRKLIDYWDKNMAILPIEDWPYMERRREHSRQSTRNVEVVIAAGELLKNHIREKGTICSSDVESKGKVDWSWAPTSINRAALESLFFKGDLGIHHRKNTKRYYDLIENIIDEKIRKMKDPNETEDEFYMWFLLRRVRSMGILTNKNSDGLLGIIGMKSEQRLTALKRLLELKELTPIVVEDAAFQYYILTEDLPLLEEIKQGKPAESKRMEFIAPLDNLMWDRKMIADLFDFEYKWEIYTPEKDRKYGYYVLPILYGDGFSGRIEVVRNRKEQKLEIKGIWLEKGVRNTGTLRKRLKETLVSFAEFNGVEVGMEWEKEIQSNNY